MNGDRSPPVRAGLRQAMGAEDFDALFTVEDDGDRPALGALPAQARRPAAGRMHRSTSDQAAIPSGRNGVRHLPVARK